MRQGQVVGVTRLRIELQGAAQDIPAGLGRGAGRYLRLDRIGIVEGPAIAIRLGHPGDQTYGMGSATHQVAIVATTARRVVHIVDLPRQQRLGIAARFPGQALVGIELVTGTERLLHPCLPGFALTLAYGLLALARLLLVPHEQVVGGLLGVELPGLAAPVAVDVDAIQPEVLTGFVAVPRAGKDTLGEIAHGQEGEVRNHRAQVVELLLGLGDDGADLVELTELLAVTGHEQHIRRTG